MATISAADVKRLREMTSAGMMECKKALEESDGDFDKAVEALRISGAAKAAKRGAERTASNGVVAAVDNTMVEVLCETDFVAKGEEFQALAGLRRRLLSTPRWLTGTPFWRSPSTPTPPSRRPWPTWPV